METTFCQLRCKQVINVVDGTCLGNVIDIVFNQCTGRICGIIVPGEKGGFWFFKKCEEIFIPFQQICKIGEDVILVELFFQPHIKGVHKHSIETQSLPEQNEFNQDKN